MKNSMNHLGWKLSRACINDTMSTKRSGTLNNGSGMAKSLYDLNIRALRETQLAPHHEDKQPARYLAMLRQKLVAPDIVITVRGGMIDEIRSSNPFTQVWIADYDDNGADDDAEALEAAEERGNVPDMHIIYP